MLALTAMLLVASARASAPAASSSSAGDGVHIIVVSPGPGATVVSGPVVVTLDVTLGSGPGAERVRADAATWRVCYALNGARPAHSFPIVAPPGEAPSKTPWGNLPPLDDPLLLVPGTSHTFAAWVERGACNSHPSAGGAEEGEVEAYDEANVAGRTSHAFHVRRKVSAHAARLAQWERQVAALASSGKRPAFLEIGTSYFDTLAEQHAADPSALWVGTSVEPVPRYLASLPTRDGLTKVHAMVCPAKGSASTATLYSLDAAQLDAHGLDQFFHGMSSSDPTHLWRSPQFRARVPLPLYRSLLTATVVPCVSYADLLDPLSRRARDPHGGAALGVLPPQSSPAFKRPKRPLVGGHRVREKAAAAHVDAMANLNVLAHLKVDAEGADVAIVRAAVAAAQHTCAWPWRVDFEAAHLHGEGSNSSSSSSSSYPLAFTLTGFPASALAGVLDPRDADSEPFAVESAAARAADAAAVAAAAAAAVDVTASGEIASGEALGSASASGVKSSVGAAAVAAPAAASGLPTVNGRFVKVAGTVGGAPAYAHEAGLWWCVFCFEVGHWVVHAPSKANSSLLGGVAAHTDAGFAWAVPWDRAAPWRALSTLGGVEARGGVEGGVVWGRLEGTSARAEFGPLACAAGEHGRRREGACAAANAAAAAAAADAAPAGVGADSAAGGGTSEALVLELEDAGYACSCADLDCACFTTPKRIAVHHPKCAPFV